MSKAVYDQLRREQHRTYLPSNPQQPRAERTMVMEGRRALALVDRQLAGPVETRKDRILAALRTLDEPLIYDQMVTQYGAP